MIPEQVCEHTLTFDVPEAAGLYSQLAGVLSGFAFTAFVLLLTVRLGKRKTSPHYAEASRAMIPCIFGLILTSVNYAELSGEFGNSGRTASVQLVAAVSLICTGTLLLLTVLALLGVAERLSPDASAAGVESLRTGRILLAHALPLVMVLSLYSGTDDYKTARYGSDSLSVVDFPTLGAGLIVVSLPLAAYKLGRYGTAADKERHQRRLVALASYLSAASLGSTFLITSVLDSCDTVHPVLVVIVVLFPCGYIAYSSVFLVRSR